MRRLLILASVASVLAWMPAPPAMSVTEARAAGVGDPVGRTVGRIDCFRFQYETRSGAKRLAPEMPCGLGWNEPVLDPRDWSFDGDSDYTGRAGNGLTFTQTIEQVASYEMTLDADGDFVRLVLDADLDTTVDHAGYTVVSLELDVPIETSSSALRLTDSIQLDIGGGGNFRARGDVSVRVECDGPEGASAGHQHRSVRQRDGASGDTGTPTIDATVATGDGFCTLQLDAQVDARNSEIIKSDHRANASARIRVEVDVPPCDLGGVVRDGVPNGADPYNRMAGIPVELLDASNAAIHREVTDDDGRYCFRDVEPAAFTLRATLEDGRHDPPIFRTIHTPSTDDVISERAVAEADFGSQEFDVTFLGEGTFPLRHEVAAVHRESARFVDWLLAAGMITVAEIGTFTVNTDTVEGTSYKDDARTVRIQRTDTRFPKRSGPATECPENCEWHEIAHHVAYQLGIPDEDSAACSGRVNHGGWRNASTCDSILEGFPSFLALAGSVALDADRGGGYGTPAYGHAWNLEDNGFLPWDLYETSEGSQLGREDFAVSQLLHDLIDSTAGEAEPLAITNPAGFRLVRLPDAIEVDAASLVRALAAARPNTIVDVRSAVLASGLLAEADTAPSIDLDGDATPDVGALDALFLLHGFHPVPDLAAPFYVLGDSIGDTRRQAVSPLTGRPLTDGSPIVPRGHMETAARSAVLLDNPGAAATTFVIDITYPVTSSHREVVVEAGSTELLELELPGYARGAAADGSLAPCGGEHERLVTVTIAAAGTAPLTFDNCAFLHAVAEADGDAAMTYRAETGSASAPPAGSAGPGATAAPVGDPTSQAGGGPAVVVLVGAAAIVAIGVLVLVVRRRGRERGPSNG